ncbi:MAG TPA: undecaprenyl-phosphate glucose phosphotransferase [Bdellovibrionales bacterium]|nr:undecaprenyl-phosphate glucose phosphotransferase [Bdellovibrionales bacterium]
MADLAIVSICWALTYWVRFELFKGETGQGKAFALFGLFLGLLTLWFFSHAGLYRSQRFNRTIDTLMAVLRANVSTIICFIVFLYFFADQRLSRTSIAFYALSSTFSFLLLRISVRYWLSKRRRQGRDLQSVLLVGHGEAIESYVQFIKRVPEAGVSIAGWLDSEGQAERHGTNGWSGSVDQAKAALHLHYVVVSYPPEKWERVKSLLAECYNDVVPVIVIPELPFSVIGLKFDSWGGVPGVVMNQPDYHPIDIFVKRSLDIVGSLVGLVVLSPLLFLIALAVKLSSRGPIFFGQERIGLDGRHFKMWKFRSMRVTAEQEGQWTTKDDPRKTAVGSFIRATSIDELPQLWNIFVGDMSIVGPRPEQPKFVEKFRHEIPAYMLRHKMKAGLTGWAQVNGWRGDTDLTKRIEFDLFYIRNWSLWFDIKIIFLTVIKGFINKNAY